ncbi:O-antigen ligase [Candidatus Chloroploca sp. Khr17]|uniref:O-antigen ligase family protein n=1 Tax=Candidatus Chloroploca sp. Khr17 TaxID=2496869 RepID=UPI00101C2684|nr:O-antigen ligase family protein [Candidatus Chloroploca sp. Khr17]
MTYSASKIKPKQQPLVVRRFSVNIEQNLYKIERFLLILLIYFAPMHKVALDIGVRLRPTQFITVLLIGVLVVRILFTKTLYIPSKTLMLLVFAIFLSSVASGMFIISLDLYAKGMITLVLNLSVLLFFSLHVRNLDDVKDMWKHWLVISIIMSVYGVLQYALWRYDRTDIDDLLLGWLNLRKSGLSFYAAQAQRITSLALDPNNLSIYYTTVVPLWTYMLVKQKLGLKWLGIFVAWALVNLVNILTLSRSGLGGLIIGTVLTFPFLLIMLGKHKILLLRIMLVLIAVFAFFVMILYYYSIEYWVNILTLRLSMSAGTQRHLDLTWESLEIFMLSPIVGIGVTQFAAWYQRLFLPGESADWNTHNGFLTILTETGIIGMIIYGIFFLYIFMQLVKVFSYSRQWRLMSVFLIWAFISYLVGNMGYNSFTFLNFWIFVALVLASSRIWLRDRKALTIS